MFFLRGINLSSLIGLQNDILLGDVIFDSLRIGKIYFYDKSVMKMKD